MSQRLILKRHIGEAILINTPLGLIRVKMEDNWTLCVEAPRGIEIVREELITKEHKP